MSEVMVTQPQQEEQQLNNHVLVARSSQEMAQAQAGLTSWFSQKLAFERNEMDILSESIEQATKNKWGKSALVRQFGLARNRAIFYEKAMAACEAGYTLIPNFPCDVFAVRVNRYSPPYKSEQRYQHNQDVPMPVDAAPLPLGEGDYKSGHSDVRVNVNRQEVPGKDAIVRYFATASDFREVQFPLIAARPDIMDTTARAMATKIFDDICIAPAGTIRMKKGDPMILGRILGAKSGYTRKEMTFLIAWFVDVRTL